MEKIVLNNKEFVLVPVEEWLEVEDLLKFYLSGKKPSSEEPSGIFVGGDNIRVAQPKVSEYRERFKRHDLRREDVTATPSSPLKLYQFGQDEFEKYRDQDGDSLFFGKGLENDF
jgi:hypothetical protein